MWLIVPLVQEATDEVEGHMYGPASGQKEDGPGAVIPEPGVVAFCGTDLTDRLGNRLTVCGKD